MKIDVKEYLKDVWVGIKNEITPDSLKVAVFWLLILGCVGYYNKCSADKKRDEHEAKTQKIRADYEESLKQQAKQRAIDKFVAQTGADRHWETGLEKDGKFRILAPVLTVELERAWIQDKPILFNGVISDIATKEEKFYLVTVSSAKSSLSKVKFGTELRLSLIAEKTTIDKFLNKHPNLLGMGNLIENIAVAANIYGIQSERAYSKEGPEEVKIGVGELLEIMSIED